MVGGQDRNEDRAHILPTEEEKEVPPPQPDDEFVAPEETRQTRTFLDLLRPHRKRSTGTALTTSRTGTGVLTALKDLGVREPTAVIRQMTAKFHWYRSTTCTLPRAASDGLHVILLVGAGHT